MKLTPQERLVAEVVRVKDTLPGGYQVDIALRVDLAMQEIEKLYKEHDLPMYAQLVAELTLWRTHAEEGVRLTEHGYHVMDAVIRSVSEF